jgi:hypothetical protein
MCFDPSSSAGWAEEDPATIAESFGSSGNGVTTAGSAELLNASLNPLAE